MTSTLPPRSTPRSISGGDTPTTPISERIRHRLERAQAPYFANDNIAAFLGEGDLEELEIEVAATLINESLKSIIEGEAMELRFLPRGSRLPL